MDRHGCSKNHNRAPISGFLLLLAILLFSAPGYTGPNDQDGGSYRPSGKYYYYPDHNNSPYNYQSTGDFANRPMVIPPSVPVMKQPAYYYMDGPKANQMNTQQQNGFRGRGYPQQHNPQQYNPQHYNPQQAMPQQQQPVTPGYPAMQGQKASYSLHVGSFLVYSKADDLDKKIKELGLKSYRKEVAAEGIRYMQLRVGPFSTKEDMQKAATLLDTNKIKNRIAIR
jgi:hypothetical protein